MMNPVQAKDLHRVYILRNTEGRRYIGVSSDVAVRLDQHNQGLSEWTKGEVPCLGTAQWIS